MKYSNNMIFGMTNFFISQICVYEITDDNRLKIIKTYFAYKFKLDRKKNNYVLRITVRNPDKLEFNDPENVKYFENLRPKDFLPFLRPEHIARLNRSGFGHLTDQDSSEYLSA